MCKHKEVNVMNESLKTLIERRSCLQQRQRRSQHPQRRKQC